MLARDKQNGNKIAWSVKDIDYFPQMLISDKPESAHTPVERSEVIAQDYFYKGMGQENLDDLYRYYTSAGCDARRKGAVLLGPATTKSTLTTGSNPTAPTLPNLGFETGEITGWTWSGSGGASCDTAAPRTGTYHMKISNPTWGTTAIYAFTFHPSYIGSSVTFTAYIRIAGGGSSSKIGIGDDTGTTWSSTVTSSAYTQVTATRTISNSSKLELYFYNGGGGSNGGYMDDMTFTLTPPALGTGATKCFCDFGGYHYAACNKVLLKWDGTDWDYVDQFPYTITDLKSYPVSETNYLFVAQGNSQAYWYSSDATAWTQSNIATAAMKYFGIVGDTLWASSSAYQIKSSTNPLNGGSWSTATSIIASSLTITDIVDHPFDVYVAADDGLYYLSATGDVSLVVPDLQQEKDSNTGINTYLWKSNIYIASGLASLYEYNVADEIITNISPSITAAPGIPDFAGRITSIYGSSEYLYCTVDHGTATELICGHWETVGSDTLFLWHHLGTIAAVDVETSFISSYNNIKHWWIGCTDVADGIYAVSHSLYIGDVLSDTNYTVQTAGDFTTSWIHGAYKYFPKRWYQLESYTDDLSATETITVYYKKEYDSSWTSLGTLTDDTNTRLIFPSDTITRKMQLKFSFASGANTKSPKLKGYVIRASCWPFDDIQGNIVVTGDVNFYDSGGMDTSWVHDAFITTPKNYYSIIINSASLSDSNGILIEYKLDDETTYTSLETKATTSPLQIIDFPENTTAHVIKLKFTPDDPDVNTMVTYTLVGELRPPPRRQLDFSLHIANKQAGVKGAVVTQNPQDMLSILKDINCNSWPVKITTYDGQEYDVTIKIQKEEFAYESTMDRPEYFVTVKAMEIKKQ